MKNILSVFFLLFFVSLFTFAGDVYVKGYYRSDGTYVQPHYRTAPDGNPYNNYSYSGNTNPYKDKSLSSSTGDVYVKGYYRRDGTYVQPHYRTAPDGNPYNNYSYSGRTGSYSGVSGSSNKNSVRYLKNILSGYKSLYRDTKTNPYHTEYMRSLILKDYRNRILEIQSELDSLTPTRSSESWTFEQKLGFTAIVVVPLLFLFSIASSS